MSTIAQNMLEGMGAAAWVVGFVALLGGFLIVCGILVTVLTYVADGWDEWDRRRDNAAAEQRRAAAEAVAGGDEPGVHAPGMGRHCRQRAGESDR